MGIAAAAEPRKLSSSHLPPFRQKIR